MPLLLGLQRNILMLTQRPLYLDASTFRVLLEQQGPSLGLWRATEIAVLREVTTYYSRVPTTVLNNVGTVRLSVIVTSGEVASSKRQRWNREKLRRQREKRRL
jgi:hypothetical protein